MNLDDVFYSVWSQTITHIVRWCSDATVRSQSVTAAVSQFRVCVLWRTWSLWSLWSLKASPSETLLTSSAVVKCDGLAFGAFPGCVTRCFTLTSRFLPPRLVKVTIYATRCRHFLSFFLILRVRKLWCFCSQVSLRSARANSSARHYFPAVLTYCFASDMSC